MPNRHNVGIETGSGEQMDGNKMEHSDRKDAVRRSSPNAAVIYEAIRKEGEDELTRTFTALAWSGFAAGLSMGFSFLMEAFILSNLSQFSWHALITKFGYSIGFLIVILGRQQLFTENTLTPMLQLFNCKNLQTLRLVARLWSIVLIFNILGALAFALLLCFSDPFDESVTAALITTSQKVFEGDFFKTFVNALFAGWLIALMVWLLPFAETARVAVIIIITYVVGLGGFAHIIAGSINAFYAVFAGLEPPLKLVTVFFIPTLAGNIFGGVAFVAAINHGQVRPEKKACDDLQV